MAFPSQEQLVPGQNVDDCVICLESNLNPMLLECRHSLCQTCLVKLVKQDQQNSRCPLCRMRIDDNLFNVTFGPTPQAIFNCAFCDDFKGTVNSCRDHIVYDCANGLHEKRAEATDVRKCRLMTCQVSSESKKVVLECGHEWHDDCRAFWTRIGISCPLCDFVSTL